MNMRLALAAMLLLGAAAEDKPNFVFILIDDLGATDLGCAGSTFYETPNIDRLASRGMMFTNAYSACTVCSPTRASLLTGKYPARLHLTDWIPGSGRPKAKLKIPDWTQALPLEEHALPRALKTAGYVSASLGKWHLGNEDHSPEKAGFDVNVGGTHQGSPPSYFNPYKIRTITGGEKGEYLTDRLTDEAVRFMRQNRDTPFFVYLPHYAVHNPLQGKPELVEKYKAKAKPDQVHRNPVYAAVIESVDQSVGRIAAALDELKISEKTVVIFTSDNGGLMSNTSNAPLRVGKGSAYEGGVRVPLIVSWPGKIAAGKTCDVPVITPDWYPTMLDLAGVKPLPLQIVDGASLVPLLRGKDSLSREALYWHYPHYHPGGATPYGAVRQGDWRLVEFFEDNRIELYNLKNDVGETKDLASEMPDKARELQRNLADWRASVGAQMPSPNPNYEPPKK
jgi:arylsulfatase A-like enzyme